MRNYAERAQVEAYASEYGYDFYVNLNDDNKKERIANRATLQIENYHGLPRKMGNPALLDDLQEAAILQNLYLAQNFANFETMDSMRVLSKSNVSDGVISGQIVNGYTLDPIVQTMIDNVLDKKQLSGWVRS